MCACVCVFIYMCVYVCVCVTQRDSETLMGELLKRPPPQWQEGRVKKWRKREARQAEELDPSEHS